MSPRAACRLESLGFTDVLDYAAGKVDWAAAGLPIEGQLAGVPRIGDVARTDAPTCGIDETVAEVAARVRDAGWDTCLVVDDQRVVLGRIYQRQLTGDADARAEEAMQAGPSTYRPNIPAPDMLEHMHEHDLRTAPVTTSAGRLVGLLLRDDVERVATEWLESAAGDAEAG